MRTKKFVERRAFSASRSTLGQLQALHDHLRLQRMYVLAYNNCPFPHHISILIIVECSLQQNIDNAGRFINKSLLHKQINFHQILREILLLRQFVVKCGDS